jgi:2-oxoglutarate/2-oxoacid ferredoxin oxidoreductase subunit alpha
MMYWLYNRPLEPTMKLARREVREGKPELAEANKRAQGGLQLRRDHRDVRRAVRGADPRGSRRARTATSPGTPRVALGFVAAATKAPASRCSSAATRSPRRATSCTSCRQYKNFGVSRSRPRTRSRRSCAAIGAAFAGSLARHDDERPRHRAQEEAIGLAVMVELPLVVVQRAARRTLAPACRRRPSRPTSCRPLRPQRRGAAAGDRRRDAGGLLRDGVEAVRIAVKYMTPVILLTTATSPTAPSRGTCPTFETSRPSRSVFRTDPEGFFPYARRSADARAAVGEARHAGPRAPRRRPREGRRHGQRQLRPGEPRAMVRRAGREGGAVAGRSRPLEPCGDRRAGDCWSSAGAAPTARSRRRSTRPAPRGRGLPPAPAPPEPAAPDLGDVLAALRARAGARAQHGPARAHPPRPSILVDAVGLNKVQGQPFKVARSGRRSETTLEA